MANSLTKIADQFFRPYNLTAAQYNALIILRTAKTKLSQHELSSQLVVSRSDITGIVDRLEKGGYVKRVAHEYDRRIKLLEIMKKGLDLVKKVEEAYFQEIEAITRSLNLSDLKQLEKFITQINDTIKRRDL